MSSTKLLLITNRYPAHDNDGASPFVADFVAALRHNRIDCTVLTPYHQADKFDDGSVVRFPWGGVMRTIGSLPLFSPKSWIKMASYFRNGYREAVRLHQDGYFDFCLALWAAPSGLFAHRLKKNCGLHYAVWCLGSDIHTYPRMPVVGNMIVNALQAADRVYSDGHDLGAMAERLSGCRCHFLPTMRKIETSELPPDDKHERLLVCPGRVEKSKGVFDLLKAFKLISNRFNSWSLCFIGEGSAGDELQKKIESFGLSDRVRSTGFLQKNEMYRLIKQSRAVVIPTHKDSLPLTFGEAMQLRRPVIVTDVGDLKYFTEKYKVGMVVPPKSPEYLAHALSTFIEEKKEYRDGFAKCTKELDIDLAAGRFADWLHNHLSHRRETREQAVC